MRTLILPYVTSSFIKKFITASFSSFTKYHIFTPPLVIIIALLLSYPAIAQVKVKHIKTVIVDSATKHGLTYKIIPSEQNSFGYDILEHTRKMVHQPSIPGLPGNKGFNKKEDAEKVAKLVIYKISHNIIPPGVSKHEMDSLKIKW